MIGKIERIKLRDVWKHEALDLTTWLQENIEILNEAIDLNISNPEIEKSAGSFKVDIVAEDDSGNPVIIENQLEKSDHEHLGKLITYLVAMEAKTAIWIVSDPKPEHLASISWLNESSSANFFLLKLEAIKIGDSPPAPLLTLIIGPSEEGIEVGKAKKEIASHQQSAINLGGGVIIENNGYGIGMHNSTLFQYDNESTSYIRNNTGYEISAHMSTIGLNTVTVGGTSGSNEINLNMGSNLLIETGTSITGTIWCDGSLNTGKFINDSITLNPTTSGC